MVKGSELLDLRWRERCEIGFSGQAAAESADGVFDAALLPGGARITEEGLDIEVLAQPVVLGELGSVVEGDGLAQSAWQRP